MKESPSQIDLDERIQRRIQFANMYDVDPILPTFKEAGPMLKSIDFDDMSMISRRISAPRYANIKRKIWQATIIIIVVLQLVNLLVTYDVKQQLKMPDLQQKAADSIQRALTYVKNENKQYLNLMKQNQKTQRNNVTSLILQKLFQLESNMKIIIHKNKKADVSPETP